MTKIRIAKMAGIAIGATLAFGSLVPMAGAQTIVELQAQINALMAQLAALQGGSVQTSTTFTMDLTLGSRGSEVVALQQVLVAQSYLVMPTGVAMGYFGPLTQAAVAKWQAANGVSPAAGYWGPISRAKYASMSGGGVVVAPTPGCPAGALFNSITGASCTAGGVITTPGVEGTIAVSLSPSPANGTKMYEGDSMKAVLGIKLEAKTSDIRVERIKLDLDETGNTATADSAFYNKAVQKIYIMDGSTVLASMDLNSSTVVEESNEISITLTGMSFVVPKDTTKVLTVAVDAKSSWDSTYNTDTWTITVPADGVRGVDGAGVNEYGPSTALAARSFSTEDDLIDSASLAISLNSNTPNTQQVICASGTDGDECDNLEVAKIDFKAEKDNVTVTDFVLDLVRGGTLTTATATTAYLYDGSTLVGSASLIMTTTAAGTYTFSDIDWTIPQDTTRTLSVQFDIDDAALAAVTFVASTDANDTTAENSISDTVTATGSADGRTITIRNVGPELTLLSKPIVTNGVPQSSATNLLSTSTLTAKFNVRVKALGADLYLGKVASTTDATQGPAFNDTGTTNSFTLYKEGAASSVNNATSTSYTIPSTCVDSTPAQTCTLAEGSSVDIEVTYLVPGRTAAGVVVTSGLYAVGLEKFNWAPASTGAIQSTTFMAGLTDWRTADVSFP